MRCCEHFETKTSAHKHGDKAWHSREVGHDNKFRDEEKGHMKTAKEVWLDPIHEVPADYAEVALAQVLLEDPDVTGAVWVRPACDCIIISCVRGESVKDSVYETSSVKRRSSVSSVHTDSSDASRM